MFMRITNNNNISYIDDLMVVGGDMAICVVLICNVQHYDSH